MKEFCITDDGIRLHAKLDMPVGYEEGNKCPLAIIIHGLTGHMEERHLLAIRDLFNEMGIATLRTEMYGHGQSEGEFRDHTILKWINNAMTVAEYAKDLDFVTDMYICGHSQGGATTMLLAGLMPDYFRAAIPLSPASMMAEWAREGTEFGFIFDPQHVPDELPVNPEKKVGGNYVRAAQIIDFDWAIRNYTGPVLIVHGDADESIPIEYSVEAAKKYANAELIIIPGDDHCYNYHLDQVIEAIRQFMLKVKA